VPLAVVYRQAARRDVFTAARSYEWERPGLAAAFIIEVERIEAFISEVPGLYARIDGDVRRAMLRRFPYGIFYLEEPDRVLILACIDLRRDPRAIARLVGRR
jgi:hypothetical protein